MWSAPADPDRFEDAVAWFRQRIPITDELLEQLGEVARTRAFRVAGVAELDVVTYVYLSIVAALEKGTGFDKWKKQVTEQLTKAWGKANAYRIETIWRTNSQTAYSRGRWLQLQHKGVRRFRPYRMFDAVLDTRTSETCKPLDGTILHQDDPFWSTHWPPLHHRCRSSVRSLTERQARRRGITTELPDTDPDEGFGKVAELDEWEPDEGAYPPDLWAIYQQKQDHP